MPIDPIPSKNTKFGAIEFQGASRVQDDGTLGGDNPRANPVMFSITSFPGSPVVNETNPAFVDRTLFTFKKGYYNMIHGIYTIKNLSIVDFNGDFSFTAGYYSSLREYYFGFDQSGYLGEDPDGTTAVLLDILQEFNSANASSLSINQPLPGGKYDFMYPVDSTLGASLLPPRTNTDGDFEIIVQTTPRALIRGMFTLI